MTQRLKCARCQQPATHCHTRQNGKERALCPLHAADIAPHAQAGELTKFTPLLSAEEARSLHRAHVDAIRARGPFHLADGHPALAQRRVDMICPNCTMEHAVLRLAKQPNTLMCHYCGHRMPCRDLVV